MVFRLDASYGRHFSFAFNKRNSMYV
jgi:hypothetical protein